MREDPEPLKPRRPVESVAEDADSRMLFEEADPLIARRTDVADAHDRYADIETQGSPDDRLRAVEPGRSRHVIKGE